MAWCEEVSEMNKSEGVMQLHSYVSHFHFQLSRLCWCIWPWRVQVAFGVPGSEHTKSEFDDLPELFLLQREVYKKVSSFGSTAQTSPNGCIIIPTSSCPRYTPRGIYSSRHYTLNFVVYKSQLFSPASPGTLQWSD